MHAQIHTRYTQPSAAPYTHARTHKRARALGHATDPSDNSTNALLALCCCCCQTSSNKDLGPHGWAATTHRVNAQGLRTVCVVYWQGTTHAPPPLNLDRRVARMPTRNMAGTSVSALHTDAHRYGRAHAHAQVTHARIDLKTQHARLRPSLARTY